MPTVNASKVSDEMPEPMTASDQVEIVECECCGVTEDCTPTYIKQTRELFHGRWICSLCAEAVAEKMRRGPPGLTKEEALAAHMAFSRSFNRTIRLNPKLALAVSMKDVARKISERRSTAATKNLQESKNAIVGRATSCSATLRIGIKKSQIH